MFLDDESTLCNASTEFRCKNSMCIADSLVCDGYDNCQDGSDESTRWDVCGRYVKSKFLLDVIEVSIL